MANARDTVYEILLGRLTAGHYPATASLIPQTLSDEFAVSRTPVREALGLLERDGLLVSTSRGFTLRRRSDEEILELFEVRAILESSAAAAAAHRASAIDLARLRDFVAQAREHTDPVEVRKAFNLFHDCVRFVAHNETISVLLRTISTQIKVAAPWRTRPVDEGLDRSCADHEGILAAIETGHAESARSLMLAHLAHDQETRIAQLIREMGQQSR